MDEVSLNRALKFGELVASGEILSCLTVDETTEALRQLLSKLDVEMHKEIIERICRDLGSTRKGGENG